MDGMWVFQLKEYWHRTRSEQDNWQMPILQIKCIVVCVCVVMFIHSHHSLVHARSHQPLTYVWSRKRVVYLLGFRWFTCNRITEDMIFDEYLHRVFHVGAADVHTLQCRWDTRCRIHGSLKLQIVESIFHHYRNNHNQNQNKRTTERTNDKNDIIRQTISNDTNFHDQLNFPPKPTGFYRHDI